MNRKALIITHDFPPAGGPGVQRVLKFVKYLPEFGWQSIVLTVPEASYAVRDESLAKDVPPETPVYRDAINPDVNRLRPLFNRLRLGKVISALNVALMMPDANLFWAYAARKRARQIISRHRPQVVFSSSPPASTHLLAQWIHKQFDLPWVTDFRDPWSQNPQTPYFPRYRSLNRWLESRVLLECVRIITVSEPLVSMFHKISTRVIEDIHLIENGYDGDDIVRLSPPRTPLFTITYTGTFSRLRRPDCFIQAIDLLIKSGQIATDMMRIQFAGKNVENYVPNRLPFYRLGYLRHDELSNLRCESDLLLFVIEDDPESHGNYSGKVFEHLACNRPTLCITHPENVAAQLIVRARGGTVVPPQPEVIAHAILEYYRQWQQCIFTYDPDWTVIERFNRRSLTERLSQVFESVLHET